MQKYCVRKECSERTYQLILMNYTILFNLLYYAAHCIDKQISVAHAGGIVNLTRKALKLFCINHRKFLSHLFPIHLNTFVMCPRSLCIFLLLQ